MASVDVAKLTGGKRGAMIKHMDRECKNHSNENINPELTYMNYPIDCKSYRDAVEKSKAWVKEVDAVLPPKRVRKDRVVALSFEVPCPRELTEQGRSDEFFQKAYKTLQDFLGPENMHGGIVHKDEVHEYYDKKKNQNVMSCEHAHFLGTPFVPDVGVNGKQCVTKGFFRLLNEEMENMCQREFGLAYMTHEAPQKLSVEELKAKGKVEALEREIEVLQSENKALIEQNTKLAKMKLDNAIVDSGKRIFGKNKDAVVTKDYGEVEGMKNQIDDLVDKVDRIDGSKMTALALYEKAQLKEAQLDMSKKALERDRAEFARLVEEKADEKAIEKANQLLEKVPEESKIREMEKFLEQYNLDGRSMLEVFNSLWEKHIKELMAKYIKAPIIDMDFDKGR